MLILHVRGTKSQVSKKYIYKTRNLRKKLNNEFLLTLNLIPIQLRQTGTTAILTHFQNHIPRALSITRNPETSTFSKYRLCCVRKYF